MGGFLNWFFAFMTEMLGGLGQIIVGVFSGVLQIFDFPSYFEQFTTYSREFNAIDWVFSVIAFILVYAIWLVIFAMMILFLRKYLRFRKSIVGTEDLLEEIAMLHRDVVRLTKEKEQMFVRRVGANGRIPQLSDIFSNDEVDLDNVKVDFEKDVELPESAKSTSSSGLTPSPTGEKRFARLAAVDEKYETYLPPTYRKDYTLSQLCDDFRNFACSQMRLYYDIKVIRLMFSGLSSTKLILLQGISGTGKTSLPYSMGKYFKHDATIASVQPSWRDRTELFGYFNEFTKKFNETEVLRRIYEATYTEDINIIVLDEMNIARVEYYFAEMLSILEMPDPSEWKIELVPSSWDNDPHKLPGGKLTIPQNVWFVGTANNDDSTYAVSDKVYDRALVINLDEKGIPFDCPETFTSDISFSDVDRMYSEAVEKFPVQKIHLDNINKLDFYVIQKFRIAFGNRIMKQMKIFVPVYISCGGTELEGIDYILATKVFRKFESLNMSLIRDEIEGLISYMDVLFGEGAMATSIKYLERLRKMMY